MPAARRVPFDVHAWRDRAETATIARPRDLAGQVPIERLAHGQKCTAILLIALADGNDPLIIDQPEDALHAPWIEERLVAKLRDLRGSAELPSWVRR